MMATSPRDSPYVQHSMEFITPLSPVILLLFFIKFHIIFFIKIDKIRTYNQCKRKMKNWRKHLQFRLQTMGYMPNMQKSYEKVNAKTNNIRETKIGTIDISHFKIFTKEM